MKTRLVTTLTLVLATALAAGCLRDSKSKGNTLPGEDVSADSNVQTDTPAGLDQATPQDLLKPDVPNPKDQTPGDTAIDPDVATDTAQPDAPICTPECGTHNCGDNGCGGNCGTCNGSQECNGNAVCGDTPFVGCWDAYGELSACDFMGDCELPAFASISYEDGKSLKAFLDCLKAQCPAMDGACTQTATAGICNDQYEACYEEPVCVPNCTGKNCGSDGCTGNCGTCSGGDSCGANGTCQAVSTDCPGYGVPMVGPCIGTTTMEGCCSADGKLRWCDSGTPYCVDCAASAKQCGWKLGDDLYDCGSTADGDPTGTFPRECTP